MMMMMSCVLHEAGTVAAVEMQATGDNWEIDVFERLVIRDQQRSLETSTFLLPTATTGVWSSSNVLLTTPLRDYSVNDYRQFFDAIGHPEGQFKVEAMQAAEYDLLVRDLGVPIYCFYSSGIPTAERLIYDTIAAFPDSKPRLEMGDGDGTVNLRSLEACQLWKKVELKHSLNVKHYPDVEHNELLHHPELIADVLRIAGRAQ